MPEYLRLPVHPPSVDIDSQLALLQSRLQEREERTEESQAGKNVEATTDPKAAVGEAAGEPPAVVSSEVREDRSVLPPGVSWRGASKA